MKAFIFLLVLSACTGLNFIQAQPLDNPYDKVGEMHNEAVKYVLQNLEEAPASDEVYQIAINFLKEKYPEAYFENVLSSPSDSIYEYIK